MLQYDSMASSMHGTIYQFSEILCTELDMRISFLINKGENNPCLAVRKQSAFPVNTCPDILYMHTHVCWCVFIHRHMYIYTYI